MAYLLKIELINKDSIPLKRININSVHSKSMFVVCQFQEHQ